MNPWLPLNKSSSSEPRRLFCFHHAGGSAQLFRPLMGKIPGYEVCAVQLPGRWNRHAEPAFTRMEPLVEALEPALAGYFDRPFAFFGCSLGSAVAFALARELRRKGAALPQHLFVAARTSPGTRYDHGPIHELPDDELVDFMAKRYAALPDEILRDPSVKEFFMKPLRADLAIHVTHLAPAEEPLPVPITAFGGTHDLAASVESIQKWGEHTSAAFDSKIFEGSHFFFTQRLEELGREIAARLPRG